ncbi:hypothetical protein ACTUVN_000696 [Pseudomonas caspiana]
MLRTLFSKGTDWLVSEREAAANVRGALLCFSVLVVLLCVVGVFFSDRYLPFIKLFPLAVALFAAILSLRLFGRLVSRNKLVNIFCIIIIVGYVSFGLLNVYVGARIYDGSQYDGAFQLFFPLKRMEAGEWPGRDFLYFHGQLIPLIIYPVFKLFGSDFFASQFSAKLFDLLLPAGYFAMFYWLGLRRDRLVIAWLLLIGLLVTNRFAFGTQNPIEGVHVYAIRSIVPFLYIALLSSRLANVSYCQNFSRIFYRSTLFFQVLVFVISFYLGSEQAFYLLLTMLFANAMVMRSRPLWVVISSVALVVMSIIFLMAANELLFGSQKPLTYLLDISRNQTWFYGSYPNEFLHSPLDFSRPNSSTFKVSAKLVVSLLGIPCLWVVTWLCSRGADRRLFFFTLIGGIYGLLGLTSLFASYSGEQYADGAIKVILVSGIIFLVDAGFRRIDISSLRGGKLTGLLYDVLSVAPWMLVVAVVGCVYSVFFVLNIPNNVRMLRIMNSAIFMSQPDLGVKIPFYPLSIEPDDRYHSSQFLALDYANGNASAKVIYPEFTFVSGYDEGVKNLYRIKLNEKIPSSLAPGDYCLFGSVQRIIAEVDRSSGFIYFNQSTVSEKNGQYLKAIDCYRKGAESYLSFNNQRLVLEQNTYDGYFYDGIYRGSNLQLRVRDGEQEKLRVGDHLSLNGHTYAITAIYAGGVVTLDSSQHPYPFDFDRGASYSVVLHVNPDGAFSYNLDIADGETLITRVNFNDRAVLAEMKSRRQLWLVSNGQSASVINVDAQQGVVDLRGRIEAKQLSYGVHFGDLDKSAFNTVETITPVFQLMKGILSAKTVNQVPSASNIDFFFHAFDTALFNAYLKGVQDLDPEFISVPSGRYVNNFIWYDNWLVRSRWPVFEYIASSYDFAAHSKFESFWRKGEHYSTVTDWMSWPRNADTAEQDIVIPVDTSGASAVGCETTAYVVEFDYSISGWQGSIPLIGSSNRHIALIDDFLGVPLTLNPNEHRVRFPVFPRDDQIRIKIKSIAPFGVRTALDITAIRYRKLSLPVARLAAVIGRSTSSVCP